MWPFLTFCARDLNSLKEKMKKNNQLTAGTMFQMPFLFFFITKKFAISDPVTYINFIDKLC